MKLVYFYGQKVFLVVYRVFHNIDRAAFFAITMLLLQMGL